jgi:hypothetical protein
MMNTTRIENCHMPDMRLAAVRRKERRKQCRARQLRSRQSMTHPSHKKLASNMPLIRRHLAAGVPPTEIDGRIADGTKHVGFQIARRLSLTKHIAKCVVNCILSESGGTRNRKRAREQLLAALTIETLQDSIARRHVCFVLVRRPIPGYQ